MPLYLPLMSPTKTAFPVPRPERTGLESRLPDLEVGRDVECVDDVFLESRNL